MEIIKDISVQNYMYKRTYLVRIDNPVPLFYSYVRFTNKHVTYFVGVRHAYTILNSAENISYLHRWKQYGFRYS